MLIYPHVTAYFPANRIVVVPYTESPQDKETNDFQGTISSTLPMAAVRSLPAPQQRQRQPATKLLAFHNN